MQVRAREQPERFPLTRSHRLAFIVTAAAVLVGDILTKRIVTATFDLHEVRRVFGDYARLTYIQNPGAAFGLFPGSRYVLISVSIVAVIIVVWVAWTRRARLRTILPLGLILGGAVGNLIDRIRLGEVVDFIQVGIPPHYWPVFNVADSAVSIGVTWLAVGLVFWGHEEKPALAVPAGPEDSVASLARSRDDG